MAHIAKLDSNNAVIQVLSAPDNIDEIAISNRTGQNWKQTSYNTREGIHTNGLTPLRKNYAGLGYIYDQNKDAFIPPKPYESWVLDNEKCVWIPPIQKPTGKTLCEWDEDNKQWINCVDI